ncbi:alcohol acetyltransferase [Hypoxylon sp. FL0543]|nr:alcohol acetyltransferase [Hypoxylon sp. FL0543]
MQFVRHAGFSERRCIARDTLGLYGAIVTLTTYAERVPQIPETVIQDVFLKALNHCLQQHAVLWTVIGNAESNEPRLEEVPQLDLKKHLRTLAPEIGGEIRVTQRLLEDIHNEPLGDRHIIPQWRLYVLPIRGAPDGTVTEYKVAFAASHALTDGMSGFVFHSTLLEALQGTCQMPSNPGSNHPTKPPDLKLPVALDQAVPLPISWSYFWKIASKEVLPRSVLRWIGSGSTPMHDTWLGAPNRPERRENRELLRTAVRVVFVPKQVLEGVLRACRKRNARLTGLLNRLAGYALAGALAHHALKYSAFSVQTAIDLRNCIPGTRARMANYFSTVSETVVVGTAEHGNGFTFSDDDWEPVRRSSDLLRKKSSSAADQSVALLRYVNDIQEWTAKIGKKPPTDSYTTSNLGVFKNRDDTDDASCPGWSVKDIAFSQTGNGAGEPLSFNFASVGNGPLSLVVCWEPRTLGVSDEEAFVENICELLVDSLTAIGSNP